MLIDSQDDKGQPIHDQVQTKLYGAIHDDHTSLASLRLGGVLEDKYLRAWYVYSSPL